MQAAMRTRHSLPQWWQNVSKSGLIKTPEKTYDRDFPTRVPVQQYGRHVIGVLVHVPDVRFVLQWKIFDELIFDRLESNRIFRNRRTYVGHSFVLETIELRAVAVDGPHGDVVARPESIVRLQGQVVVLAEGLKVHLLVSRFRTPPVYPGVQHRHHLVLWNWVMTRVSWHVWRYSSVTTTSLQMFFVLIF